MFKAINYVQALASDTWVITHNLGMKPVVDVMSEINGEMHKMFPAQVIHTSDNVLTIKFTSPRTGKARLVGVTGDFILSQFQTYWEPGKNQYAGGGAGEYTWTPEVVYFDDFLGKGSIVNHAPDTGALTYAIDPDTGDMLLDGGIIRTMDDYQAVYTTDFTPIPVGENFAVEFGFVLDMGNASAVFADSSVTGGINMSMGLSDDWTAWNRNTTLTVGVKLSVDGNGIWAPIGAEVLAAMRDGANISSMQNVDTPEVIDGVEHVLRMVVTNSHKNAEIFLDGVSLGNVTMGSSVGELKQVWFDMSTALLDISSKHLVQMTYAKVETLDANGNPA